MKKILIIISLALASCSSLTAKTSVPTPTSILTSSDCDLPCWHGITIATTTKQELLAILGGMSIVNQDSITVTKSVGDLFEEIVSFTMGEGPLVLENGDTIERDYSWSGEVALLNDKVEKLVLDGDLGITFQQVIDLFGEPGYVIPSYTPGGHVWVEAINPSRGVDFGYRADDLQAEITPNTPIAQITLFDVGLYDQMIDTRQFVYLLWRIGDIERFAWKGYGTISIYWHDE